MQYARKWIVVGLLFTAPVLLLAQPPAPNPGPPSQIPQNQAPPNQVLPNQAPPNHSLQPVVQPGPPGAATPASATPAQSKTHKVQKELVLPPLPSGPLPQLPMDQIPASPAKVSFHNGLLTISAENSTLGEILRDVRKLTGASIDIPAGSGANERVVARLGPGAPRDVLAVLLNGSSFNYVMIGSNADPQAVSSVILTSKLGEGQAQTASNEFENSPSPNGTPMGGTMPPGRSAPMANLGLRPGLPQNPQPADDGSDASTDDQDAAADDSTDDQSQPMPPQPVDGTANAGQDQQPDANQPNAGPKTPEQILEMLRRQQPPGAVTPQQQPPQ